MICQQIFAILALVICVLKFLLKCFKIVVLFLWRRDPVVIKRLLCVKDFVCKSLLCVKASLFVKASQCKSFCVRKRLPCVKALCVSVLCVNACCV